ncbi:hypothetical protein TNCV_1709571 [Trichonephila clavipes]|nr:hypothetical protein TNCV_1709571 [Trichonephila clavipes]
MVLGGDMKTDENIWREPWAHCLPSDVQEIYHYYSKGLMVWIGITLDNCTHLHVFARDNVTAATYSDEFLEAYACIFTGVVDPGFILMANNMRGTTGR